MAEKDVMLRNVMKHENDSGNHQEGDLSLDQKKQFYFTQMELDRLRKIIVCKACNDREKEVILLSCFHCFC